LLKTTKMKKKYQIIGIILLSFCFGINFIQAQNNLIKDIKSSNEKANFEKSKKTISKYKEKYDTLNCNFLIGLSDFYIIKKNYDYDLRKSLKILNSIYCQNFTDKDKGIYLKNNQDCNSFLAVKKADFIKSYFYTVLNSSNKCKSCIYYLNSAHFIMESL